MLKQRAYQLRQIDNGKCRYGDGRKILKWGMCKAHVEKRLAKKRELYQKNKLLTKG